MNYPVVTHWLRHTQILLGHLQVFNKYHKLSCLIWVRLYYFWSPCMWILIFYVSLNLSSNNCFPGAKRHENIFQVALPVQCGFKRKNFRQKWMNLSRQWEDVLFNYWNKPASTPSEQALSGFHWNLFLQKFVTQLENSVKVKYARHLPVWRSFLDCGIG